MTSFPGLVLRASCGGMGVFSVDGIQPGRNVMHFEGAILSRDAVKTAIAKNGHDGFLQIGIDTFMGQSGGLDDYVNHACNPNCYIAIQDYSVHLIALRHINRDEEITFDYATTQIDFPFRFDCVCGDVACRGNIGNVNEIPVTQLETYLRYGALPEYILEMTALV